MNATIDGPDAIRRQLGVYQTVRVVEGTYHRFRTAAELLGVSAQLSLFEAAS